MRTPFQRGVSRTPYPSGYRARRAPARRLAAAIFGSLPMAWRVVRVDRAPSGGRRLGSTYDGIDLRVDDDGRTSGRRTSLAKPRTERTHRDMTAEPASLQDGSLRTEASHLQRPTCRLLGSGGPRRGKGQTGRSPLRGRFGATFQHRQVHLHRDGIPESYSVRSERWRGTATSREDTRRVLVNVDQEMPSRYRDVGP